MTNVGDQAPRAQRAHGAALAMTVICAAQFVLQLDFSIVNVALPTIQRELHMAAAQLHAGGRLADLLGRRRLLAAGLVWFAIASLVAGLSEWPVMLIVARLAQGAAGAMVSPAALSLLTTTNPDGPARARALSIWQATTAAGATTGIVAGGVLTQSRGGGPVSLSTPPIIAIMLTLFGRLPASRPAGGSRVDVPGAALVTAAIAALIFGLSNGQQNGFGAPLTIRALVAAAVLAAAFVWTEQTVSSPMLPLQILAGPTRRAAVAAMLMIGAVLAGYVYFLSLFLQRVQGLSPVETGLALVPATVTVVITSTLLTRRLLARLAIKYVLLIGLGCMAAGQLWFDQLSPGSSYCGGAPRRA